MQRLLRKRLSDEARLVLNRLSVATIPLGKPTLQVLCPRKQSLKELRDTSPLAAYTNRIQVLPIFAWTVQQQLSPEQQRQMEELVIEAYTRSLDKGNLEMQEAGNIITELAVLLMTHQRLIEIAQLVVHYGWISLQSGHGPRLAHLAQEIMEKVDWHQTVEYECASLVLVNMLFPFLDKPVETKGLVNYEHICDAFLMGKLVLHETTEGYIVHQLVFNFVRELRFTEAEALVDAYHHQLAARHVNPENSESWLHKRALLLGIGRVSTGNRRDREIKNHARRNDSALSATGTIAHSATASFPLEKDASQSRIRQLLLVPCLPSL